MPVAGQNVTISLLERILATLAAVVCLIITILFWFSISSYQNIWPLPSLYFVELVAISIISAFIFVRGDPRGSLITWGTAGVISAFSILGAFSIGFFYLPIALLFTVVSITWDVRNKQHLTAHLGIFFVAGIVQSVLMFIAIRLHDPSVVFYVQVL
jgi:hypothetical protein